MWSLFGSLGSFAGGLWWFAGGLQLFVGDLQSFSGGLWSFMLVACFSNYGHYGCEVHILKKDVAIFCE